MLLSCNENRASGNSGSQPLEAEGDDLQKLIEIVEPAVNMTLHSGESINFVLNATGERSIDSVKLYFDGQLIKTLFTEPWSINIDTENTRLGNCAVKAVAYSANGRPQTLSRFVTIFSDIIPPVYKYKVVAAYPHDITAYTQGLLVYNGSILESTGEYGLSSLREVEIETGKVMKQHNLDSKYFCEGLALLDDKLYQLTWTTNIGFVYDVNTFAPIRNIHYNTEGWGLTSDKGKLYMSDGSNRIYVLEPEYFTVTSSFEVFDNRSAVRQLNELEFIDGELWANIYQTDRIARIDPLTGKVIAYIDLSGILDQKDMHPNIDYLNGIAWEEETGKIFVTGKRWPKIYEITLFR
jgi:glutamine cyclotransferase